MTDLERSWVRGDWMQTHSGRRYYPLDPRSDEIEPSDIAHALSLLCRYGGHIDRFYSVAEHCVLMSQAVAPENALVALLHDATEAYVGDVVRPLKRQLPGYKVIEDRVWYTIAVRFGLDVMVPAEVKEADNRILITERLALMPKAERWGVDEDYAPLEVEIHAWAPPIAEQQYRLRLEALWTP